MSAWGYDFTKREENILPEARGDAEWPLRAFPIVVPARKKGELAIVSEDAKES